MFLTIIIFILILGILIFAHELGHFITAKRAGIKVDEFGFGFPPRIFGVKKGETTYSLNLFPIGGFVKIYGEEGEGRDDIRSFSSKSLSRRAIIIAAGVTMNLVLAALLLSLGHWVGLPSMIDDEANGNLNNPQVQIIETAKDSPVEKAGIKIGDTIASLKLKVENEKLEISRVAEVREFTEAHRGEEVVVIIQRGDEILEKTLVLRENPPEGEGPLGAALVRTAIVSYPWYKAIILGITSTVNLIWVIIAAFLSIIWNLITTGRLITEIAGPVGIFTLTSQAAKLGFIYVLQFTALLSINLAIINILPFPALDGGRLLFLFIEKIKGSPVSQKIEKIIHTAGFIILILLMLAVTWRDVVKLF
ncbi:MAG: RIP metalloprotease RseP [Candidatus Portnoybacteria bacterium RIFCSPLOWO2_01_FULL_43_11]|uniref:Zinc metalloprotease n=3 Tax=Candidatus Portnoyibacteriota TaxID=1817913 RepID=A0A1G2FC98_9BACT|nr:MAG: RIP metalloprotease RseP [Candidatus Portnoybacteria bacterium RIFCSPHIGHO2_01_FULL_40_12b]OGZ39209.1 MAG: RIP metalloprotease RseP [Candidatus Portnoybacteria bacterium RIFCSPLOWO2_01_FULL_43_11]OGZ39746.1 MAG: RIP metalloprotease RseP [Candidatus Portnoybacteria bacterium RIFCSPLOWO2_02_FULL_40_15]